MTSRSHKKDLAMGALESFVSADLGTFHLNEWLPAPLHSIVFSFFFLMDCFYDLPETVGSCLALSVLPAWPWSAAKTCETNISPVVPQKRKAEEKKKKRGIEIRENKMENQNGFGALFYLWVIKSIFLFPFFHFSVKPTLVKFGHIIVCMVDATAAKLYP